MKNKKGQMQLGEAPSIVLLVGLVFLVMATFAFVGEKFGDAILTETSTGSVTNENHTSTELDAGSGLSVAGYKNVVCTIGTVANETAGGTVLTAGNYTQTNCNLANVTTLTLNTGWIVNYTYIYTPETTAYNTTGDLQNELSNNTSIAGIILTISLVGIVLTILIGVFIGMRRPRI